MVEKLASYGAHVVLGYTSASSATAATELAQKLEGAHGVRTLAVQGDMGSLEGPAGLVAATRSAFGGESARIDIIVNNAGVAVTTPMGAIEPPEFDRLFHVNVRGPLLLVQAAMPHLPRDRSGRIVNVSSISATTGQAGQAVYGATKAALDAMTRSWARELAERCTVTSINPGPVATDMYGSITDEFARGMAKWNLLAPLARCRKGIDPDDLVEREPITGGRPAYVTEIAGIVAMLCSPDSAWCTGQVVCANGGMVMIT